MRKIVLVEDNADLRSLGELVFRNAGFEIAAFSNASDALKFIDNSENIDAVITDLAMSPVDGLTLAEQIRLNELTHATKKPVQLAFMTAHNVTDAVKRVATKTNTERIFTKPINPETLIKDVTEWLN